MVSHRYAPPAPVASRPTPVPDPEVRPTSERRTWTPAEKLRILREAEACRPGSAERGALLRREGLYSSHLSKWRHQRERGALAGAAAPARGPKPTPRDPMLEEVERVRQENTRLQRRLMQAEAIIAAQKNIAIALGIGEAPTPSELASWTRP